MERRKKVEECAVSVGRYVKSAIKGTFCLALQSKISVTCISIDNAPKMCII